MPHTPAIDLVTVLNQMQDDMAEAYANATKSAMSPWANRHDAALYAGCSESAIDRAANAGIIKRYERAGSPAFKKSEIDTAIETGKWKKGTE